MFWMSLGLSPDLQPLSGSLLVTEMIVQTGFGSQLSESETLTVTRRSVWFGGLSTLGLAEMLVITGGVVSGVTAVWSAASAKSPPLSVTRRVKSAAVAPQAAAMSAVTLPDESTTILEIVTPLVVALVEPLTVTVRVFLGSSASLTVEMDEFETPASC